MAAGEQRDTGQSEQTEHEDGWGHLPSQERQDELDRMLRERQESKDHGEQKSEFDGVRLTGSDAFCLAARSLVGLAGDVADGVERLKSDQFIALADLHLEGANLRGASLEHASLIETHLEHADLRSTHLEHADLRGTHLEHADLRSTHLEHADLRGTHLEHTYLYSAHLEHADLRGASLDKATQLNDAVLNRAHFDQTIFDNTNLAVVPWDQVQVLGDELRARTPRFSKGNRKSRARRRADYEAAVRAHRQLAARLADQGMIEQANRFIYRALILQRKGYWFYFPRRLGTWIFSWILFLLAGYGYRPLRTLFWYLATIASFAALFFGITHGMLSVIGVPSSKIGQLSVLESVVLSVSSFHGRGFFQPAPGNNLGDPVFVTAAAEAVFGLFIEVSFIATFTQRFFSNR